MNTRQTQALNRLIAVRAFLVHFAEVLSRLVPTSVVVEIDRLIEAMQRVAEKQQAGTPNQLRHLRNQLRKDLLTLHIDQVLSAIRASGLSHKFKRYRAPRRFANRRLVVFTRSLLFAADANINELHLPPDFIKRSRELLTRYDDTFNKAELATEQAPKQAERAAVYESRARALIAHVHTLIAPYIGGLTAELEWNEVRILPSHHGPKTPRLSGPKGPTGLLSSGPLVDESDALSPSSPDDDRPYESPDEGDTNAVDG